MAFDLSLYYFDYFNLINVDEIILVPEDKPVSAPVHSLNYIRSIYTTDTAGALFFGSEREVFGCYFQDNFTGGSLGNLLEGRVTYTGETRNTWTYGLNLGFDDHTSTIKTTSGRDQIIGSAITAGSYFTIGLALFFGSTITTGGAADTIQGTALNTGSNQSTGSGTYGILLSEGSILDTGDGCDTVTGAASDQANSTDVAGIGSDTGDSYIRTGRGNDKVIAMATGNGSREDGFNSRVDSRLFVQTGADCDSVTGYGHAIFDGGSGVDTFDLRGYRLDEFKIYKPNRCVNHYIFDRDGIIADISNFEIFRFDGDQRIAATLPTCNGGIPGWDSSINPVIEAMNPATDLPSNSHA